MSESKERKQRRHFSDDQKAAIVRRHLDDKVPVSDLADEYQSPLKNRLFFLQGAR